MGSGHNLVLCIVCRVLMCMMLAGRVVMAGTLSPYTTNLTVGVAGNQVDFAWTSVRDMNACRILYEETPVTMAFDGNFDHSIEMGGSTSTSVTLPDGASYHVAIQCFNEYSGDYTAPSNVEHIYMGDITQLQECGLPAPQNLRAQMIDGTSVLLNWDPVTDALGYRVYVGDSSGDYAYEAPYDVGNVTFVTASGFAPVTTRYVVVTAYGIKDNPSGPYYAYPRCEGRYSNEVAVITEGGNGSIDVETASVGTLSVDVSASTISGTLLRVTGNVPAAIFPDGTKLDVDLYVKGVDHPNAYSAQRKADTFKVVVNGGTFSAEVEHDANYAPLTYDLQLTYYASSNFSSIRTAVAERLSAALGVSPEILLVARKDIVIGTVDGHLSYRRDVLFTLSQSAMDFEESTYAELSGLISQPWDTVLEEHVTTIESGVFAWRDAFRYLGSASVAEQETALLGQLSALPTMANEVIDAYRSGNDAYAASNLADLRNAIDTLRTKLNRKLNVLTRVVHLRTGE